MTMERRFGPPAHLRKGLCGVRLPTGVQYLGGVTIGRHTSTQTPVGTSSAERPSRVGAGKPLLVDPPLRPAASTGRPRRSASTSAALARFSVPAVVLWWHVWSGHPAASLTCGCGDPAQEVWFIAWPAWAIAHLHNLFFSGAVNVPAGANLLSNTSGTLVGVLLAPVTWLFGPVAATNVALTLARPSARGAVFARSAPGDVEGRLFRGARLRLLGLPSSPR